MQNVVGIFGSREAAQRSAENLRSIGISDDHINVLAPGAGGESIEDVPTTETEQPGMGAAIGGVVGGALGAASGMSLGAAAASLLVPGVGPIMATGILGAALLGAGGAVGGAAAGDALEGGMADGLPRDELYVYEDALRQGHTVVVALVESDDQAEAARKILDQNGAESLDAAREKWWLGLRDAEQEYYAEQGGDFHASESNYRCGFECALHPELREHKYSDAQDKLRQRYADIYTDEAFRRGYERGQTYHRGMREKFKG